MMGQRVQSCVLGGTSGEGVQWTVDDLDGGGGLMANKHKSLASESDGNMFVGKYHTFVGSLMGGAGKVPLVRKLNYLKKFSRKSYGI